MPSDGTLTPKNDPINAIANYFKGWEIFEFRMEREQRLVEYREEMKRQARDGRTRLEARKEAQRKFGYTGLKEEREQYAEHLKASKSGLKKEGVNERSRRHYQKHKNLPFERALETLPPTASPAAEMEWIKSHPAMSRKDRSRNTSDRVLVTPEDIHSAPNGPCPSRAAAQQLQHWANRPEQFFKDVLSETKKAKARDEEEEAKERATKTNTEINQMLSALFGNESESVHAEQGLESMQE